MDEIELYDDDFRRLRELVYRLTGISLSESKRQLLKSRLQRRMRANSITSFGDYYTFVVTSGENGAETREFINAITTNKTDFFRERHHFDYVRSHVVPELLAKGQTRLRVWHAGCSTGEEPYTLAMTLNEIVAQSPRLSFGQLASDIDTDVLAHAERGIYAEDRVKTIGETALRKWFLRGKGDQSGLYKVRPELSENLTFRRINLLDDPWPIRSGAQFDIIFCRNVLIYFDKPTQGRLFHRFHSYLKPGGYLFLGHSESMHGMDGHFSSLGKTIYRTLPAEGVRQAA